MSSFDLPGQPPAVFAQVFEQQSSDTNMRKTNWLPLMLEPTQEPVWPEDEEQEVQRMREIGKQPPELMSTPQALHTIEAVRVWLPDRLFGCALKTRRNKLLPAGNFDYYCLYVPTNFSTDFGVTPRRLRLELTFDDAGDAENSLAPIACYLYPGSQITTSVTHLGQFEIDLGGAIRVVNAIWPAVPDVLTAKTGGSIDLTTVHAKVQAAGLNSRECEWRIADTSIAYDFNPACVVQVPNDAKLAVNASLHVEARRRIAKVFYKTYYKTARPMRYVLSKANGDRVNARRLKEGASVTLRRPGVPYADERTKYSYISDSIAAARSYQYLRHIHRPK
jgi:hypothetical protein